VKLAKVHCTFANCRKSTVRSPIAEIPEGVLAKVQCTFAIGESHIGENLIGEIPEPHGNITDWQI